MRIETDSYRTEPGEWVIGGSVYRNNRTAVHRWVINLELGRKVTTFYISGSAK